MDRRDDHRENGVLEERVNLLRNEGYRGFVLTGSDQKRNGVAIKVKDKSGKELEADGETPDEACEVLIEKIDYFLDDKPS